MNPVSNRTLISSVSNQQYLNLLKTLYKSSVFMGFSHVFLYLFTG